LIGGGFWHFKIKNETEITRNEVYQKSNGGEISGNSKYIEKDSDNDGLKNWEETLWRTDPKNPDTDGDGANDGEEIKLNRNPLVAGPNDKLESFAKTKNQKRGETLTQKLGRTLFSQYFILKDSDQLNEVAEKKIIQSFLENLREENPAKKYSLKDLKIINSNTKKTVELYINSVGLILKDFDGIQKSELEIMEEIITGELDGAKQISERQKQTKLKKLAEYNAVYEKVIEKLLKISVPSNYKEIHLGFINNFSNTNQAVKAMKELLNDPAEALLGMRWYLDEVKQAGEILKALGSMLKAEGIRFGPEEDGYALVKYIQ
jgi:hypothetical protein